MRAGRGESRGPGSWNSPLTDAAVIDPHAEIERLRAEVEALRLRAEAAEAAADHDVLTPALNRRGFVAAMNRTMAYCTRYSAPAVLLYVDLDGFKSVNDEFGHAVGDETLRDVGQILMKHSRGINVVSRYGGDEFAVLLVETSKAGARLYADRIREVVAKYPFSHGKVITASFGVASLPDDEAGTAEDLFRAADEALYAAKRAGKNQVAATPSPQRVP